MRYVRRPIALCAICSFLLPAAAQGQASEALDPDSPAGVEYQLPLEQARKNAGGRGADDPDSGRRGRGGDAALFGAGIVPVGAIDRTADGADGATRNGIGSDTGAGGSGRDGGAGGGEGSGQGSSAITPAALDGSDEGGSSASLRIAGIALAVLLAGAVLGLALRRGLGQSGE